MPPPRVAVSLVLSSQLPIMTYSVPYFQPWAQCGTLLVLFIPQDSNPQSSPLTSDRNTTNQGCFLRSALHFCSWSSSSLSGLIFSIFKHSACLWVYLGIWGFLFQPFMWHCCMFGAEKVPQSTGLCLLPCLSSLLWVFTSSGDCAGRGGFGSSSGSCGCSDMSRCELITHQLSGGLMSCQIFDEIDR